MSFRTARYLIELQSSNVGWFRATTGGQGDLWQFKSYFDSAVLASEDIDGTDHADVKAAAKSYLRGLYRSVPWVEMKIPGYDAYVRPPQ
jgi:hypothetical protein